METKCYFCDSKRHPCFNCPARDHVCYKCKKKGHFSSVCLFKSKNPAPTATLTSQQPSLSAASPVNSDDDKVNVFALVNGVLASYDKVNMLVMDNLMWDVILGREFLKEHESVSFAFGGPKCPLNLNSLDVLQGVTPVRHCEHLTPDCRPVASKSRNYSPSDRAFIATQTAQMLRDGIIEPSTSPWRAQVVVVNNSNHKKRLSIDYSQTINKFTFLDAYPLPLMQTIANSVAQYNWYSSLELKSACHQVPILPEERLFTAFETNGQLYQFKRIPFGLKNAVPYFQRMVNEIISKYNCKGTYAYLDDITVRGRTREEHDENLKCFLTAAKWCNITFNKKKCRLPIPTILPNCWATTFRTACCCRTLTVSVLY